MSNETIKTVSDANSKI